MIYGPAWAKIARAGYSLVENTIPGLPGEAAGIERGDVPLRLMAAMWAARKISFSMVSATAPGTPIELEIFRDGEIIMKTLELALRSASGIPQNNDGEEEMLQRLQDEFGVVVFGLTLAERLTENLPQDVGGAVPARIAPNSGHAPDIIQCCSTPIFDGHC